MFRQKHKIVHMLGELLHYMLQAEPQKVVITIEDLADKVQITVKDIGVPRSEEECRQAERILNGPSRNEMKDYYGGLAGEETFGPCGLRIVAMMTDGGQITCDDEGTQVSVWWKQE